MRIAWLALAIGALATPLLADDTIQIFGSTWTVPLSQDWKVSSDQGAPMLQLLTGREPAPGPRRPSQFALRAMAAAHSVDLEADVRPTKRSLMIVFAYQDAAHFDYLHLSTDTGLQQPMHNGVFHIYGGERVRISNPAGIASFPSTGRWYHVAMHWDGAAGTVQGFVDGRPIPALRAVDLSLKVGRIGIGSFDETADFKNVRVEAR